MPLSVQYALLDMAFNLGTPHLAKNWPKLHQAIKQQDWQCAAQECSRRHIQNERNTATEQLFKQASKTSSPTTKPSVLSWITSRIKSKLLP